jgi:hypothetical protein
MIAERNLISAKLARLCGDSRRLKSPHVQQTLYRTEDLITAIQVYIQVELYENPDDVCGHCNEIFGGHSNT